MKLILFMVKSLLVLSIVSLTACDGGDKDDSSSGNTTENKTLEHLDVEPESYSTYVQVDKDSFITDGTLSVFRDDFVEYSENDEMDTYGFTATQTGNYTYYLEVGDTQSIKVNDTHGNVYITSEGLGEDVSGSFYLEKGENYSFQLKLDRAISNFSSGTYILEISKPSEPVATQYISNTITDDSSNSSLVLECEAYSSGMCAKYVFSNLDDKELFLGSCSQVSSCTDENLLGICDTGTDDVTGGTGTVQSDLYLYSPTFTLTYAQDTCIGLDAGGTWK